MKKSIYLLIAIFLITTKGFSKSFNPLFSNSIETTEKPFSALFQKSDVTLEKACVDDLYLSNGFFPASSEDCYNESRTRTILEKGTRENEEVTIDQGKMSYGISASYRIIDEEINNKRISSRKPEISRAGIFKKVKLQNVDVDDYYKRPVDSSEFKGFGIRLGI